MKHIPATIIVGMLAVLIAVAAIGVVAATTNRVEKDVRITARLLENGKVEFGLQERTDGGDWGETLLPSVNKFPYATAPIDRWLFSSPVSLTPVEFEKEVRITARLLENGKVEFGLQERTGEAGWGDTLLPSVNKFPYSTATIGHWLFSSKLALVMLERVQEPPWPWEYFSGSNSEDEYVGYRLIGENKSASWPYHNLAYLFLRCYSSGERHVFIGTDYRVWEGRNGFNRVVYRVEHGESQGSNYWSSDEAQHSLVWVWGEARDSFVNYLDFSYTPGKKVFVSVSDRSKTLQLEFTVTGLHGVLDALPCFSATG